MTDNSQSETKEKSYKELIELVICILLIIFVILFGFLYIKEATDAIRLRDPKYRNLSQVEIYADIFNGRGIIIAVTDDHMDILTSRHLVETENKVTVEFGNGKRVDSEVYSYFKDYDAAVIRIYKDAAGETLRSAKAAEICTKEDYDNMKLGQTVYFATEMSDAEIEYVKGKWVEGSKFIYELGSEVGLFLGEVLPGMSGEGVFDENDRLVGMIIAATDTEGALIPAYELKNEYLQWTLQYKGDTNEND
ncbi:MAG: serine protease [Lachnospiraceae bacterium]|nr:serine protease [Lachnospiraceae bacterium]